uniref:BTB domain-containing protein n=1 Tax=Panagrolaimus superbus TaxID=310955 RepID=A0A914ZCU5_9BILA
MELNENSAITRKWSSAESAAGVESDDEKKEIVKNSVTLREQFFESLQDIFKRQDPKDPLFDIVFLVEKKEIYAHMLIFRLNGAKKLLQYIEKNGTNVKKVDMNVIDGKEVTHNGLYIFIKCLYFNNVENDLTPTNVMLLLCLAKFFGIQNLIEVCQIYLNGQKWKNGALILLEKAIEFLNAEIVSRCLNVIDWAKNNASLKNAESIGANCREILGEALTLIPFEEMNPDEIFEIEDMGILTAKEALTYLKKIHAKNKLPTTLASETELMNHELPPTLQQSSNELVDQIPNLPPLTVYSSPKKQENTPAAIFSNSKVSSGFDDRLGQTIGKNHKSFYTRPLYPQRSIFADS